MTALLRVVFLACFTFEAGPALAQVTASFPRPGERIRITIPSRGMTPLSGTLIAVRADSLLLDTGAEKLSVPRSLVARLEVSRGKRSQGGRGALIGLAGGLTLGGIIGYAACNATTSPASCFESQEGSQYYFLVTWAISGAAGALLGAVIGGRVRGERWQVVPLVGAALGSPGHLGIGIRAWMKGPL